jgi:hypothetical protein
MGRRGPLPGAVLAKVARCRTAPWGHPLTLGIAWRGPGYQTDSGGSHR